MNTINFIKNSLEFSSGWMLGLVNDMIDAPLIQPTSSGGNHPLWVIGHLTHSESSLVDGFILNEPNRFSGVGRPVRNRQQTVDQRRRLSTHPRRDRKISRNAIRHNGLPGQPHRCRFRKQNQRTRRVRPQLRHRRRLPLSADHPHQLPRRPSFRLPASIRQSGR